MQLTGKQIIERGIVYNHIPKAVQQQGVDVRVDKVRQLTSIGKIMKNSSVIPAYREVEPWDMDGTKMYCLEPGYYEIELMEGIKMPNNAALVYKTRSSLVRSGAIVESGQFDAGFETEKAGCFLIVHRGIYIEKGARIAQAIVHESDVVSNTYDGQFQNDKQRK